MRLIPYGHQSIDDHDIEAVVKVLKSDYLTQGPKCSEFESDFSKAVGSKSAIAVNSGTSALHIACLSLGLGPGDILWTSPISFVASANCALYCGATVDFVDINPGDSNISISELEKKLELAKSVNTLPKIVVIVHFAGLPCDLFEIKRLSDRYGFKIIEDAAHALGAIYRDSTIGDCRYSDITTFSFHPIKSITTAEGGMLTTNDAELSSQLCLLRSHGITRDAEKFTHHPHGDWYYEQVSLGFNYRLSDMSAALGISQLKKLDLFVEKRLNIAQHYRSTLNSNYLQVQGEYSDRVSSWHIFPIQFNAKLTEHREQIFNMLRAKNIGVNIHYIPIHLQPYYQRLGFKHGDFPNAEAYYQSAITLPIFVDLSMQEVEYVIETLNKTITKFL